MLSPIEIARIKLLSHSKNMLNAAESGEWERLEELDRVWQKMLQNAIELYHEQLDTIIPELLDDNKNLQILILKSQNQVLQERSSLAKDLKHIKAYLK